MAVGRVLIAGELLGEAAVLLKGLGRVIGSAAADNGTVCLLIESPALPNDGGVARVEVRIDGLTKSIHLIREAV